MASVHDFKSFIRQASDSNNFVKITPQGRIKIIDKDEESTSCFAWFFKESYSYQDAKFSYEVLKSVIEIVQYGQVDEDTDKKVVKTSKSVFSQFKDEITTLETEEIEELYSLPGYLIMNLMQDAGIQKQEYLERLNSKISESVGSDLDRLIHNNCLMIEVRDGDVYKPNFNDTASITDFCVHLTKYFNLSISEKGRFVNIATDLTHDTYFERYFGKAQTLDVADEHKVVAMKYLLNGITQSQYNLASGILTKLCDQPKRVSYTRDTHDNVSLFFDEETVIAKHFFEIELQNPQTIICVDTVATFRREDAMWTNFSMAFKVNDLENASNEEWEIQRLFEKSGYA